MPKKPSYDVNKLIDQLFNEESLEVRRYIPDKLAKMGDWRSTEPLGKVLTDPSQPLILRNECAESLGKQGDPRALQFLEVGLGSEDAELRRTCIWSIGQIGIPEGVELLRKMFSDPDLMCQRWIAKSLGRIAHPKSAKALLEYYNFLSLSDEFSPRVFDDIIRAAVDLTGFLSKDKWVDICLRTLETTDRMITLQAILNLLNSMESCPFGPEFILNRLDKFWHPLTKNGIGRLCYSCHYVSILEKLWLDYSDPEILVFLVAERYPQEKDRFLAMCKTLDLALAVGRGLLLGNHLDLDYLDAMDEISSESLDFLQIRYELLVRLRKDISIINEMLQYPQLVTKAIRLLEYFGESSETVPILQDYGLNGEKKHVQAVVSTIGKIFKNGIVTKPLLEVLESILENERVWHIRRDARLLLRAYSQKI